MINTLRFGSRAAIALLALAISGTALGAVFTVNVTTDKPDNNLGNGVCDDIDGKCSLRAAIAEANQTVGPHTIIFAIPGGGAQVIAVGTGPLGAVALPIIQRAMTIDGTTQPGWVPNFGITPNATSAVITLVIDGIAAPATSGLTVETLGPAPISFAQGVTIKGINVRNFAGDGIDLHTGFNTVVGCFIGTNELGTVAAPNGTGISLTTNAGVGGRNRIGIAGDVTSTNLISGNTLDGVNVCGSSTSNTVVLNLIGTDKTGTVAIGNHENGVWINGGSSTNTIGGSVGPPTVGNLISGNGTFNGTGGGISGSGVLISGTLVDSNVVYGNLIGVDRTGLVALPNAEDGVQVSGGASLNKIGNSVAGFRNVISGNLGNGVQVNGSPLNIVQGNVIGANAALTGVVPNRCDGILVSGSANTIGGTALAARNVIGGSTPNADSNCPLLTLGNGIQIRTGDTNSILNNSIGWDEVGTIPLPNAGAGILISGGAAAVGNEIGDGTAAGANSIYRNVGLGISLGDGVTPTPNGANPGSGPNHFQNDPVITSVVNGATQTTVIGSLTSEPLTSYRVSFFTSATPNGSGFYQGAQYEGTIVVVTDAGGLGTFNTLLGPPVLPLGSFVTATATNVATGDTSEFSVGGLTTPVELIGFTAE